MTKDPAVLDEARATLDAAAAAVRAAVALFEREDIKRELVGSHLDAVGEATEALRREASRSLNRWNTAEAGMQGEPDWHDCGGIFDLYSASWNLEVLVDDERDPEVLVDASDAVEANRRAITWAVRERDLPEAIPVDGAVQRLAGNGTREITPGRWRVTIEGW